MVEALAKTAQVRLDPGATSHRRPCADPDSASCRALSRNPSRQLGRWTRADGILEPIFWHRFRGANPVSATPVGTPAVGCGAQRGLRAGPGGATPSAPAPIRDPTVLPELTRIDSVGSFAAVGTRRETLDADRIALCGSDPAGAGNPVWPHAVSKRAFSSPHPYIPAPAEEES